MVESWWWVAGGVGWLGPDRLRHWLWSPDRLCCCYCGPLLLLLLVVVVVVVVVVALAGSRRTRPGQR